MWSLVCIILFDNIPLDKLFKRPQMILCVQKAKEQNKFIRVQMLN